MHIFKKWSSWNFFVHVSGPGFRKEAKTLRTTLPFLSRDLSLQNPARLKGEDQFRKRNDNTPEAQLETEGSI